MLEIRFTTGNAAFNNPYTGEPDGYEEAGECSRILSMIQTQLVHGYREGSCIDYNGNKVGEWSLE